MFKNNNVKFLFAILLTAIISAGITFAVVQKDSGLSQAEGKSDDPFEKLYSTYDTLKGEFYQATNQEKLVDGAIKGMLQSLDDPYSTYMDQEEAKGFNENISSSFEVWLLLGVVVVTSLASVSELYTLFVAVVN